jgi:hypothetical protein
MTKQSRIGAISDRCCRTMQEYATTSCPWPGTPEFLSSSCCVCIRCGGTFPHWQSVAFAKSFYTGARLRSKKLAKNPELANVFLLPLAGVVSQNVPKITEAEYNDLVDATGRERH